MVKVYLKRLLRKLANAAGLYPALYEIKSSHEALAAGLANIEMKLYQLEARDQQTPSRSLLTSSLCKESDFFSREFLFWLKRINQPFMWHRKLWELVFTAQALHERDVLSPGTRGLGFGVGIDPLTSLFATFGCHITATDLASTDPRAAAWIDTNQHADNLLQLRKEFCPEDKFNELVSFRHVDMTKIPDDLRGFDFLWSCCAFEHLGSLEHGKKFVLDAMKCLRPGGIAVHTTEFCLNSDDTTLEASDLAFYRKKDILDLQRRLTAGEHSMAPLDFDEGTGVLDHFVDYPPYGTRAHLRLELAGFVATSIGLIIKKKE